ncbi:hypothetical protein GGR57DRAFT_251662 [Xylariaceae sp. FL1272]|nr:hypothetical protein GGR57DRAFT_251662 [Xylariaceae sp. FL1272]
MNVAGNALIFGGGGGIGKACALAFSKSGCRGIMIADINLEAANDVSKEISAKVASQQFKIEACHVDITSEDSVKQATAQMVQSFGRIDYCVNSAGVGAKESREIAEFELTDVAKLLNVNAIGTFLVTSIVSKAMKTQEAQDIDADSPERGKTRGSIVNLGSAASLTPIPQRVSYTASKHAVVGITKNAAIDNLPHDIRVNCVCPSWVDTPLAAKATGDVAQQAASQQVANFIKGILPKRRMALPAEVADVVLFLSSPMSSYMTGNSLLVDGGLTLHCRAYA